MALKSVIDIDINDGAWKRFIEQHQRYQEALQKAPVLWKHAAAEAGAMADKIESATDELKKQAALSDKMTKAENQQERELSAVEKHWQKILKHSEAIKKNAAEAGSTLSNVGAGFGNAVGGMSGISGILGTVSRFGAGLGVGGLVGAGIALLGEAALGAITKTIGVALETIKYADSFAHRIGEERRAASGFGMSIGQNRAFGLYFGRAIDTDSFLSDVVEAQTNPAAAGLLYRFGINPAGKTGDVALQLLDRERRLAVSTDMSQLGLLNTQWGTHQSIEDWLRLKNMSEGEYQDYRSKYMGDQTDLNVTDAAARQQQNLANHLDRNSLLTDNVILGILGRRKVAGAIGDISDSELGIVRNFARNKHIDNVIDAAAKKVGDFAKSLSSPETQQRINKIIDELFDLGNAGRGAAAALWGLTKGGVEKGWDWSNKHSDPDMMRFLQQEEGGMSSGDSGSTAGDSSGRFSAPGGVTKGFAPGSAPQRSGTTTNRTNNTTYNYTRGGGSTRVDITVSTPPGYSVATTLTALNGGLA